MIFHQFINIVCSSSLMKWTHCSMQTPRNERFCTNSGHLPPTFCPFPAGAVEEVAGRDKSIQMGNVHCITMFPPQSPTFDWAKTKPQVCSLAHITSVVNCIHTCLTFKKHITTSSVKLQNYYNCCLIQVYGIVFLVVLFFICQM